MTLLFILAMVIALTFGVALLIATFEQSGGFLGDSSMVPSVLVIGLVILVIIVGIGFATGYIGIWVK